MITRYYVITNPQTATMTITPYLEDRDGKLSNRTLEELVDSGWAFVTGSIDILVDSEYPYIEGLWCPLVKKHKEKLITKEKLNKFLSE